MDAQQFQSLDKRSFESGVETISVDWTHLSSSINPHFIARRSMTSLVPRPSDWWAGREGRPGIHCMRMRRYYSDFE